MCVRLRLLVSGAFPSIHSDDGLDDPANTLSAANLFLYTARSVQPRSIDYFLDVTLNSEAVAVMGRV